MAGGVERGHAGWVRDQAAGEVHAQVGRGAGVAHRGGGVGVDDWVVGLEGGGGEGDALAAEGGGEDAGWVGEGGGAGLVGVGGGGAAGVAEAAALGVVVGR